VKYIQRPGCPLDIRAFFHAFVIAINLTLYNEKRLENCKLKIWIKKNLYSGFLGELLAIVGDFGYKVSF